jgi:hypothetical protein
MLSRHSKRIRNNLRCTIPCRWIFAHSPYNPWPEDQYDRIWRIDYTNGKATIQDLPYAVLPGDSK